MLHRLGRRLPLFALLCLGLATAPASAEPRAGQNGDSQGAPDLLIQVDCAGGDSLQQALDRFPRRPEQITVEIHGFCQEAIAIRRKVIIRGTDSSTDGIAGPASLGTQTGLVAIDGVDGFKTLGSEVVRLEHLAVTGSPRLGVTVNNAQVGMLDVVISRHVGFGLLAFGGASVFANAVTISDNGGPAISSTVGGRIDCVDCQITNNGSLGQPGVSAGFGGLVRLSNTAVTGTAGVEAAGGEIQLTGGSITAVRVAASVPSAGSLVFRNNVQVAGSVVCSLQGRIDSRRGAGTMGLNQSASVLGLFNQITNGCFFLAGPGTTVLANPTAVGAGAYLAAEGPPEGTAVQLGQLSCGDGGRVTGGSIFVNGVPGIPPGC